MQLSQSRGRLAALFLGLALLAFGPALAAPFDFDDAESISQNESIRRLWPPSAALAPPRLGTAVSGRPVVNYSFALNYALNRRLGIAQSPAEDVPRETIGFHVVNVLLQVASALLLFGVIRRTIRFGRVPEDWRDASEWLAAIVAGIWLVHPIQTEAVDYVTQRTELLVSLFYVGTLYASVRAWVGERATARQSLGWSLAAMVICLLGMGSKEVMITAPLMVILYDRAFLASDWKTPWSVPARRWLYVALLATSAVSLWFIASRSRGSTAGFDVGMTWYQYLYSQAWANTHYVGLLLWPAALTFDYGRAPIADLRGVPGFVGLTVAAVATVSAWRRASWRWLGFLGAWFFLLLAPSSSVVPIRTEIAAERRVHLAIAAVIVLLVVAAEYLRRSHVRRLEARAADRTSVQRTELVALVVVGAAYVMASGWTAGHLAPNDLAARWAIRAGAGVVAAIVAWCLVFTRRPVLRLAAAATVGALMIALSFQRSALYADLEARWRDAIEKSPANGRAYDNLASAELRANPPRIAAADSILHRAMAVDPGFVPAWVRSATIATSQNRLADAAALLEHALRLHPGDAAATDKYGKVLLAEQRPDLALPYVKQFAEFSPSGESLTTLGLAYLMTRQLDSAIAVLERASRRDSMRVDARRYLAGALVERERGREAIPYIQRALELDPTSGVTFGLLGVAYAQAEEFDQAARAAGEAVARAGSNPVVFVLAGRALQSAGYFGDAVKYLELAVRLAPNDPQAVTRLGMAHASLGDRAIATRLFQRALMLAPGYPLAVRALGQPSR